MLATVRRTSLAIIIFVLLVSAVAGTLITNRAFAQFGPPMNGGPNFAPLLVNVTSPTENQVYNSTIFRLNFTVTKPKVWFTYYSGGLLDYDCQGQVNFIRYSIDGKPSVTIPANDSYTGLSYDTIPNTLNYSLTVPKFSQGLHTISVSAEGVYDYFNNIGDNGEYGNNTVVGNSSQIEFYINNNIFYINNNIPPEILNLSISNEIYNSTNVPLNFTVNEPTSWIGYSLDGKANVTIAGNTTLTALSNGAHSLTIYANNTFGNVGASEPVTFTIAVPFPIVPVAAVSGASAVVVVAGLLVYFKKHKPKTHRIIEGELT